VDSWVFQLDSSHFPAISHFASASATAHAPCQPQRQPQQQLVPLSHGHPLRLSDFPCSPSFSAGLSALSLFQYARWPLSAPSSPACMDYARGLLDCSVEPPTQDAEMFCALLPGPRSPFDLPLLGLLWLGFFARVFCWPCVVASCCCLGFVCLPCWLCAVLLFEVWFVACGWPCLGASV
jgi:hypothetical protein